MEKGFQININNKAYVSLNRNYNKNCKAYLKAKQIWEKKLGRTKPVNRIEIKGLKIFAKL